MHWCLDTSQAVFVARLTQDFGKCLGIEILSSLHDQGVKIVNRWSRKSLPICISRDDIMWSSMVHMVWHTDMYYAMCWQDAWRNDVTKHDSAVMNHDAAFSEMIQHNASERYMVCSIIVSIWHDTRLYRAVFDSMMRAKYLMTCHCFA